MGFNQRYNNRLVQVCEGVARWILIDIHISFPYFRPDPVAIAAFKSCIEKLTLSNQFQFQVWMKGKSGNNVNPGETFY